MTSRKSTRKQPVQAEEIKVAEEQPIPTQAEVLPENPEPVMSAVTEVEKTVELTNGTVNEVKATELVDVVGTKVVAKNEGFESLVNEVSKLKEEIAGLKAVNKTVFTMLSVNNAYYKVTLQRNKLIN